MTSFYGQNCCGFFRIKWGGGGEATFKEDAFGIFGTVRMRIICAHAFVARSITKHCVAVVCCRLLNLPGGYQNEKNYCVNGSFVDAITLVGSILFFNLISLGIFTRNVHSWCTILLRCDGKGFISFILFRC